MFLMDRVNSELNTDQGWYKSAKKQDHQLLFEDTCRGKYKAKMRTGHRFAFLVTFE